MTASKGAGASFDEPALSNVGEKAHRVLGTGCEWCPLHNGTLCKRFGTRTPCPDHGPVDGCGCIGCAEERGLTDAERNIFALQDKAARARQTCLLFGAPGRDIPFVIREKYDHARAALAAAITAAKDPEAEP